MDTQFITQEPIHRHILWIRGKRVMIDADLAKLYGPTTKRLNEQVKRNFRRFPQDFMFQLTENEKSEVVANCDHLKKVKYSNKLPCAFTEYGAVMLASVLNTPIAIDASIQVVRAFILIKKMVTLNHELARKIAELEGKYDQQFKVVFDAIRELMKPQVSPKSSIGFKVKKGAA